MKRILFVVLILVLLISVIVFPISAGYRTNSMSVADILGLNNKTVNDIAMTEKSYIFHSTDQYYYWHSGKAIIKLYVWLPTSVARNLNSLINDYFSSTDNNLYYYGVSDNTSSANVTGYISVFRNITNDVNPKDAQNGIVTLYNGLADAYNSPLSPIVVRYDGNHTNNPDITKYYIEDTNPRDYLAMSFTCVVDVPEGYSLANSQDVSRYYREDFKLGFHMTVQGAPIYSECFWFIEQIVLTANKTTKMIPRYNSEQNDYVVTCFSSAESLGNAVAVRSGLIQNTGTFSRTQYGFKRGGDIFQGWTNYYTQATDVNYGDSTDRTGIFNEAIFGFAEQEASLCSIRWQYYESKYIYNGAARRVGYTDVVNQSYNPTGPIISLGVATEYDDNLGFQESVGGNNIGADINIKDFYRDISIDFNTDDGILLAIQKFFVSLFTQTLPNILNNFIVWFCCESPIMSPLLSPFYLSYVNISNYVKNFYREWIITGSIGVLGAVVVVIFIFKWALKLIHGDTLHEGKEDK